MTQIETSDALYHLFGASIGAQGGGPGSLVVMLALLLLRLEAGDRPETGAFPVNRDAIVPCWKALEAQQPLLDGWLEQEHPPFCDVENDFLARLAKLHILSRASAVTAAERLVTMLTRGKPDDFSPLPLARLCANLGEGTSTTRWCVVDAPSVAALAATGVTPAPSVVVQQTRPSGVAMHKLRLAIHGAWNVRVQVGDILKHPAITRTGKMERFDRVFVQLGVRREWDNAAASQDVYHRFPIGIPAKSRADLAMIMHALAMLRDGGRIIALVNQSMLTRLGMDELLRETLVREGLLKAVITLPKTHLQCSLLIVDKMSPSRDGVLFVDATKQETFETAPLLVADAAAVHSNVQMLSHNRLAQANYSLEARHYVQTAPFQKVDIAHLQRVLTTAVQARDDTEQRMAAALQELIKAEDDET